MGNSNALRRPGRHLKHPAVLAGLALSAAIALGAPPASAHSFFAFGFGFPIYAGPPVVYGPPAYYPPPPPVAYYPPPAYYPPAGAPQGGTVTPYSGATTPQGGTVTPYSGNAQATGNCREYQTTTTIGGVPRKSYGTACLQPDGSWRLVN